MSCEKISYKNDLWLPYLTHELMHLKMQELKRKQQ